MFPPSQLSEMATFLSDYLNQELSTINIAPIDWLNYSQSDAAHKDIDGELDVNAQPDPRSVSGSQMATPNFTAIARIQMTLRGNQAAHIQLIGLDCLNWLLIVTENLKVQFGSGWEQGRIGQPQKEKNYFGNQDGPEQFEIKINLQYFSEIYGERL